MKKYILILSLGLLCAVAAFAQTAVPPAALVGIIKNDPADTSKVTFKDNKFVADPAAVLKERDELKTQNTALIGQLQQTAERMQYFQKLADVNQLAIKLVNDELTQWKNTAFDLQRKLDEAQPAITAAEVERHRQAMEAAKKSPPAK